jgi:hypothetical protein
MCASTLLANRPASVLRQPRDCGRVAIFDLEETVRPGLIASAPRCATLPATVRLAQLGGRQTPPLPNRGPRATTAAEQKHRARAALRGFWSSIKGQRSAGQGGFL